MAHARTAARETVQGKGVNEFLDHGPVCRLLHILICITTDMNGVSHPLSTQSSTAVPLVASQPAVHIGPYCTIL